MNNPHSKIIAIDVDLSIVDSVTPWKMWYTNLTGDDLGKLSSENNNLETLMKNHSDPLKFWRNPELYDNLDAIPESLKYIKLLKNLGLDIIFVSACMPEHEESKRHFIRRNFPYFDGFISTSDKSFVRCDYFVDDYKKYCRQMLPHAKVYQIKSELNSSSNGEFPYMDWQEIYEDIKQNLENV